MKKIFILFLITLLFISCKKEYIPIDKNLNGFEDSLEFNEEESIIFRNWFTNIVINIAVEKNLPYNYSDCAGLIKFAYKETLKKHDASWLASNNYKGPIFKDLRYNYPDVPFVGVKIFRKNDGIFDKKNIDEDFSEYVTARYLIEFNLEYISKDIDKAKSGDILAFFHPEDPEFPYHLMIYIEYRNEKFLIYHTGPIDGGGYIKVVKLSEFYKFDPSWLPVKNNKYFLGVFKFKLLML
ncbi:DUF1175 family protein [Marinitoga sp. 38H-ov]|uniref:DUF1175 family protein n=1 Tax=Marinitoga sp. 38H-ov TaxID=1755814 RepID=UPI0013EB872B|nr:DUF1175 family protein [Marinitoga sp. 38H-ov]KAF2956207.1 hypothetical protein AS160_06940 [Marinitoga sp. 38H-ov]